MPTPRGKRKNEAKQGSEFFYKDAQGKRCDAALHEGNEEGELAVEEQAKKAAMARGLSAEQAEQWYGSPK